MMKLDIKKRSAWMLIIALLAGVLTFERPVMSTAESTTAGGTDSEDTSMDYGLRNPIVNEKRVVTWDCVYFGRYWQNDTNKDGVADKEDKQEPIKWRVLSVDGNDAFLLADKNLERQPYNDVVKGYMTWRVCTLRSWLNAYDASANESRKDYSEDSFIGNAFTAEEQTAIMTTKVVNESNPYKGTSGGLDTNDKIYLLSISEATNNSYGFYFDYNPGSSGAGRLSGLRVGNTAYVSEGTVYAWWLRSPGSQTNYACEVYCGDSPLGNGYTDWGGYLVYRTDRAVRPVLHLDLSQTSVWEYAGQVTSDDPLTPETPTPIPTATPTPIASSQPTEQPAATPTAPDISSNPTTSPSVSQTPDPTSSPVPTATPTPTASSQPTEQPAVTPSSPSVSSNPAASPSVSQTPIPTNPPVSTIAPVPGASSQPSGLPMTTPASRPTLPPNITEEEQTEADRFVNQHVKDPAGNIITEVTDLTRDILVAGEKDWKKLTENSQTAVDVRLWEAGSSYTYEQLLELAKAYKIPGFKIIKFMKKNSKAKLKLIKCKGAQIVCVSSNKKVATINKKGVLHAKKPGRARVTFAAVKGIYTNRLVIDVRVKKKFKNAKELTNFKSKEIKTPTVLVAKKRLLKQSSRISVYDLRGDSKVSYKPIQKQILTVNKKGRYTGKKRGSTLVKVTIHQNNKDYLLYLYVTIH